MKREQAALGPDHAPADAPAHASVGAPAAACAAVATSASKATDACAAAGKSAPSLSSAAVSRAILSRARYKRPEHAAVQIVLVGCGGSGGWLAPALTRISADHAGVRLVFIDPDTVEAKNLLRQNFCEAELGANKAEALAARYGQAWGVDILAVPEPFDRSVRYLNLYSTNAWTLIIGCVDNAAARASIAGVVASHRGAIGWLDCGNTETSGQVVFGTVNQVDALKLSFAARGLCTALPTAPLLHPELLTARAEETVRGRSTLSCADLALRNRQIAVVNKQIAVIAEWYTLALMAGSLDRFQTMFALSDGVTHTCWISPVEIAAELAIPESVLTGKA